MLKPKAARPVASLQSTEQEGRGQAQRDRDDRRGKILLVLVLMQGHARAGLIAVDQAGIRSEPAKARMTSRQLGELAKRSRHRRPWLSRFGIVGVITIAAAIGD